MGEQSKTHWKKYMNKDYMGAWSLPNGKDQTVTIDRVERGEIQGQGGRVDIRPIAYFKEFKEPMVINMTNGKIIQKVLGSEYVEDWRGKKIQLYVDKNIKVGKGRNAETVDGLRVRDFVPTIKKEDPEKKKLQEQIRSAFASYTGKDRQVIVDTLTEKTNAGEDTVAFLRNILNQLHPAKA